MGNNIAERGYFAGSCLFTEFLKSCHSLFYIFSQKSMIIFLNDKKGKDMR